MRSLYRRLFIVSSVTVVRKTITNELREIVFIAQELGKMRKRERIRIRG